MSETKIKNSTGWLNYLVFVVVWIIMLWVGYRNLDPDFGWHLKMGEVIMTTGIPATDPFSYTMPSFPFVDHEWLTNAIWYLWYGLIGKAGMAAIYATLTVGALLISIPKKLWKYSLVPLFLGLSLLVYRGGIRPQVGDWLFLAILYRAACTEDLWKKWKYLTIPFFWLWANLHGGFALGPAVLGFILTIKSIRDRQIHWHDFLILAVASAATLINPYGLKLWGEVWMQMTDGNLKKSIAEWLPFYARTELGFWMLSTLLFSFWTRDIKSVDVVRTALVTALFVASLFSLRHMPLFMVVAVPIGAELIYKLRNQVIKLPEAPPRWRWFYRVLTGICLMLFLAEASGSLVSLKNGSWLKYPDPAINYLVENNINGRIFTQYGWGGYFIWKYPSSKIFVDGRMPSWRWQHNIPAMKLFTGEERDYPPEGESDWAFADYQTIVDKGEWKDLFDRYKVEVVVWGNVFGDPQETKMPKWWAKIFGERKAPPKNFIEEIERSGWKKVFSDPTGSVYLKS